MMSDTLKRSFPTPAGAGIATLPNRYRRRREKVFGQGRTMPLDRNAKARIMMYARAWSVRHKAPGQHRGPLTRAYIEVLGALLWGFHNSKDGRCFPSYETIAERAQCCRDTVYEAIKALEAADILTWVNRLVRVQFRELDLFGKLALRSRLIRTSNAYVFRDPLPCADRPNSTKSENPPITLNQDFLIPIKTPVDPKSPLEIALSQLKTAVTAKEQAER